MSTVVHKGVIWHMEWDGTERETEYDCYCPIGHDHDEEEVWRNEHP